MGKSTSGSDVQFYPGQARAVSPDVFGEGGLWDQIIKGKPDAAFERGQSNALEMLKGRQAMSGTLNTPLGTRLQDSFLQKSNMAMQDNSFQKIQALMQPAGSESASKSAGFWGGKG